MIIQNINNNAVAIGEVSSRLKGFIKHQSHDSDPFRLLCYCFDVMISLVLSTSSMKPDMTFDIAIGNHFWG